MRASLPPLHRLGGCRRCPRSAAVGDAFPLDAIDNFTCGICLGRITKGPVLRRGLGSEVDEAGALAPEARAQLEREYGWRVPDAPYVDAQGVLHPRFAGPYYTKTLERRDTPTYAVACSSVPPHVFHAECLAGWYQSGQRTCPDCRAPLVWAPPAAARASLSPPRRRPPPPTPVPGGFFGPVPGGPFDDPMPPSGWPVARPEVYVPDSSDDDDDDDDEIPQDGPPLPDEPEVPIPAEDLPLVESAVRDALAGLARESNFAYDWARMARYLESDDHRHLHALMSIGGFTTVARFVARTLPAPSHGTPMPNTQAAILLGKFRQAFLTALRNQIRENDSTGSLEDDDDWGFDPPQWFWDRYEGEPHMR